MARNIRHRNRRRKLCGEKLSHLTREEACRYMGMLQESKIPTPGETIISVYFHKDCGGWHVGHTPRAVRERFGL